MKTALENRYMKGKDSEQVVGRILEAQMESARCEFQEGVQIGDVLYFHPVNSKSEKILARVDQLEVLPTTGLRGWVAFLERIPKPPSGMTPLYVAEVEDTGILHIGFDFRGNPVRLHLNPLYNHTVIAGMTQRGKTHLITVLLEELAKKNVPALVFDPQGEFTNLPEKHGNVVVLEHIEIRDLLAHLQQRHIVVVNLLGLLNSFKVRRVAEILTQFKAEKERDYQTAENRAELLQIPPTLIFIDEAELFAPELGHKWGKAKRRISENVEDSLEPIVDVAKRGAKFGIGLIVAAQRINELSMDVRSNCNSAVAFTVIDGSNRRALSMMSCMTKATIDQLKTLLKGECIMRGELTTGSRLVKVRDLETRKAKRVDFENMLGISGGKPLEAVKPSIVLNERGDVFDKDLGKVLQTKTERVNKLDKEAFEDDKDDGVLLRDEPLPEEVLKKIEEDMKKVEKPGKMPFKTHVSDEDLETLAELRKAGTI